jgi:hypothetical protein
VAPAAAAGSRAPGPDSGAGGTARPVAGTAASTLQDLSVDKDMCCKIYQQIFLANLSVDKAL